MSREELLALSLQADEATEESAAEMYEASDELSETMTEYGLKEEDGS